MKFGVREICDVVFKAKSQVTIGNTTFGKDEPVLYFDTLKTSSLEGAATTVYAQGGGGNSRLIAWEGERTLTFTMEDALLSPLGFAILSGAGLIEANATDAHVHVHQTLQKYGVYKITGTGTQTYSLELEAGSDIGTSEVVCTGYDTAIYGMILNTTGDPIFRAGKGEWDETNRKFVFDLASAITGYTNNQPVLMLVDYYVVKTSGATQLDITPDKFGYANFYVEASTLFRRQSDGVDMPAEFVIPNAKIQSNFTFSLASTGDPSTFTFTLDAFPDYTKWNKSEKVLAAIQIIGSDEGTSGTTEVAHSSGTAEVSGQANASDVADV